MSKRDETEWAMARAGCPGGFDQNKRARALYTCGDKGNEKLRACGALIYVVSKDAAGSKCQMSSEIKFDFKFTLHGLNERETK